MAFTLVLSRRRLEFRIMNHDFKKEVQFGIGIILLSFAVFGVLSFWLESKIRQHSERASSLRTEVVNYSQALTSLAELRKRVGEVEKYRRQLETLLPAKEDLIEFPKFLEDQGRVRGVGIRFSFRGESAAEPGANQPGSIGFSIDATGSKEGLASFFRYLEGSSAKFISVLDSLDVNRSGSEYRAAVVGRVFFR